ncbi:MAG: hypothetical protein AAF409_05645 [Pseudomonadota bacterium]
MRGVATDTTLRATSGVPRLSSGTPSANTLTWAVLALMADKLTIVLGFALAAQLSG